MVDMRLGIAKPLEWLCLLGEVEWNEEKRGEGRKWNGRGEKWKPTEEP